MVVSPLKVFSQSFHDRECIHSSEKILVLRQEANERAKIITRAVDPLQPEEEVAILRYYQQRLHDICLRFHLPPSVEPLAQWYLLRLSLQCSFMLMDGKYAMVICALIASKVEGVHDAAGRFLNDISNLSKEKLIKGEYEVLKALAHQIRFHQPMDALLGLLLTYKSTVSGAESVVDDLVIKSLADYYTTDALIFLRPSQLALGCLMEHITEEEYIKMSAKTNLALPTFTELISLRNQLRLHKQQCTFSLEQVSAIDRRIIRIRKSIENKEINHSSS